MAVESADLRATAFHEAGHAVAAIILGLRFDDVTIGLDGADLGGVTFTGPDLLEPNDTVLRARIVVAYAGRVAERRFTGCTAWLGARADDLTVQFLADAFLADGDRDAVLAESRRVAEELIGTHWTKVEQLADALLARPRLTHQEAVGAMR